MADKTEEKKKNDAVAPFFLGMGKMVIRRMGDSAVYISNKYFHI